MWLPKLLQREEREESWPAADTRSKRPRGFAEVATFGVDHASAYVPGMGREGDADGEPRGNLPFASTGPHGHRARLREKLLDRGPDSLADYELLEMLLFFAQPRGDTKPLAKSVINRFGSFARVLAAPQKELFDTPGLGPHSVAAI